MLRRLRTTVALGLLVACALPAASADAATRHVVRGAGFGHGIGMSQYGAYGFALKGRSHREILAHYYTGTQLGAADTELIRVLLQGSRSEATFQGATRAPGKRLDARRTYRVRRSGSNVELRTARGKLVQRYSTPFAVTAKRGIIRLGGTALNGLTGGRYRGALEFRPGTVGGVTAVNAVSLDDYVQGVVPGEVPASWPVEALKAQSVAARTYALATDAGGSVFDQYPDTRSQVYKGLDGEHPATNAAVQATAGQVVRYQGKIATTFFFSTSGGETEDVQNVFYASAPTPYLVSVEDPFDDASPKHRWRFNFTQRQVEAKLDGLVKGRFKRVRVVRRGRSPRIVFADVIGSAGNTRVRGATLRTELGLFDTWAYFTTVRTSAAGRASASGSWIERMVRPRGRRSVTGSFQPTPRARKVAVEQRRGRAWRTVRRARTSRGGRYRVAVPAPGVYRVRAGSVVGPAVRVR